MILHILLAVAPAALATFQGAPPPAVPTPRPDRYTGMFAFDPADVLEFVDGPMGRVRVHYSVDGPNVTLLDDADQDGLPDFPQEVAATAEEVMDFYEGLGFRRPLSEADMGLGELGGSDAFDVYLVDFAGQGDGMFATDACESSPNRCSGYFVMENDFVGYGYSSLSEAIRTLTSHELFHAVQHAYESGSPIWYTEGTAVWAQRVFDPDNDDFLRFAGAYLDDTGRSLDKPPTGPVPTFAYATCLWWEFLSIHLGDDALVELQEALETDGDDRDTLEEMERVVDGAGAALGDLWHQFATWNLATKGRAGALDGYEFASRIGPVDSTVEGWPVDDDNRFYPLAAYYFRLDHPGGELWFANEDGMEGLRFSLHAVEAGERDGPVEPAALTWRGGEAEMQLLAEDLEPGGWWVAATYPERGSSSRKARFCLGDRDAAAACYAPVDTGDTGLGDQGEQGGCGCGVGPRSHAAPMLASLGVLLAAGFRRRRRP